jgi:GntR family transcriptional regulator, carbon starvation induced regulator
MKDKIRPAEPGAAGDLNVGLSPSDQDQSKTAVDIACDRIRSDILCGNLAPGTKLRIDRLNQAYGIGLQSLREALAKLTMDGLVLTSGKRGFMVKPVSLGELKDITEMRQFLECRALAQAIEFGDLNWEGCVVAAYHKLSRIEQKLNDDPERYALQWEDRNREFHTALISACPSPWLLQFQSIMYGQSQRYRMLSFVEKAIPRDDTFLEHKKILEATLDRAAERATDLLFHHILKAAESPSADFHSDESGVD